MKILVLINTMEPGGGEVSAVLVANALAESGSHEVTFAARPGPLTERLDPRVRFEPLLRGGVTGAPSTMRRIRQVVSTARPAVIHVHGARLALLTKLAISRSGHSSPIVMTHHSRGFGRIPHRLAGLLLRYSCTHMIAVSDEMSEELESATGRPERVSIIPHPVDTRRLADAAKAADREALRRGLSIPADAHVVSIACRLVEGKGLHLFISSVLEANRRMDRPVIGLIAGDGPLASELEEQVSSLGAGALVRLLGFQADILPMLAVSDIALFPSESELLPVFLVEASASGVPVICSDIPGNREVITDGLNGILVSAEADYPAAIAGLLSSPGQRIEMGSAGTALAFERFDSKMIAARLEELYLELV